jgi:hypothetical protein
MRKLEQKFLILIEFVLQIILEFRYSQHFREKFILLKNVEKNSEVLIYQLKELFVEENTKFNFLSIKQVCFSNFYDHKQY